MQFPLQRFASTIGLENAITDYVDRCEKSGGKIRTRPNPDSADGKVYECVQ
ncbi:hypothetical protein F183_A15870 [Bryobacterales bacterium F-183]|nr:hypothetical protein F183_A15870 [Bryobacterales bacterium F-183]